MFCMNCGKELPDDANFCLKCGKPQRAGAQAVQEKPDQWETCEIVLSEVEKGGWSNIGSFNYCAQAIGPEGTYTAGGTDAIRAEQPPNPFHLPFESDKQVYRKQKEMIDTLVAQLIKDGWIIVETPSPTPMAWSWWSYKFRRKVTADTLRAREQRHQNNMAAAKELLTYLRAGRGVKISFDEEEYIVVHGTRIKPETRDKIIILRPYLVAILKQEQGKK
jgi:hypothetical protein